MFNNEFYRLCDQLHGELQSMYQKYPDMDPVAQRSNPWATANYDATIALQNFIKALDGFAGAASGIRVTR